MAISNGPLLVASLGATYAAAGRAEQAREILEQLNDISQHAYASPYQRALIHVR